MKAPLLSCLFLIGICYVSLSFQTFVVSSQCPGNQQTLLLQLKSNLTFDPATSKKLVKWNNGLDYCSWEGVSCKNGCVSNLDLSSEVITGGLDNSSSLIGLKSIESLNLAYNLRGSFAGNKGLYGPLLPLGNIDDGSARFSSTLEGKHSNSARGIDWDLIGAEVGFIVGLGIAIGSLVSCKRWSK